MYVSILRPSKPTLTEVQFNTGDHRSVIVAYTTSAASGASNGTGARSRD